MRVGFLLYNRYSFVSAYSKIITQKIYYLKYQWILKFDITLQ